MTLQKTVWVTDEMRLLSTYRIICFSKLSNHLVTSNHKASVSMSVSDFDVRPFIHQKLHDVKMSIEACGPKHAKY